MALHIFERSWWRNANQGLAIKGLSKRVSSLPSSKRTKMQRRLGRSVPLATSTRLSEQVKVIVLHHSDLSRGHRTLPGHPEQHKRVVRCLQKLKSLQSLRVREQQKYTRLLERRGAGTRALVSASTITTNNTTTNATNTSALACLAAAAAAAHSAAAVVSSHPGAEDNDSKPSSQPTNARVDDKSTHQDAGANARVDDKSTHKDAGAKLDAANKNPAIEPPPHAMLVFDSCWNACTTHDRSHVSPSALERFFFFF